MEDKCDELRALLSSQSTPLKRKEKTKIPKMYVLLIAIIAFFIGSSIKNT